MGSLRTLFALSVVLLHEGIGNALVGGRNAVQLFYVVSGFLISYILVESKSYKTVGAFYLNRFLRLYPVYAAVAILTLAAYAILRHTPRVEGFFDVYRDAPATAVAWLAASNVVLFGQDWICFVAVKAGSIVFSSNFLNSDVVLYKGLVLPQAWTLGLELSFYLIAPYVLRRRRLIYAILLLSVSVRLYLFHIGIGLQDPWSYRFFPAEIALFLCGALAHQLLLPLCRRVPPALSRACANGATALLILLTMAYPLLPFAESVNTGLLLSMFICLVPLTFLFQQRHVLDSRIGDLSYPIYINHVLAFHLWGYSIKKLGFQSEPLIAAGGVLVSISFAILLNAAVAEPIEKLRRRVKQTQARSAPPSSERSEPPDGGFLTPRGRTQPHQ
jgi:peptidoglycan/LPS O-acetylase OafA/YrhL